MSMAATDSATAKKARFGTPSTRSPRSAGSSFAVVTPIMANIRQISTLRPMRIRYADPAGAAQNGARSVKWNTRPFQISLNQSMPQSASPAKTTLQFRRSASTAYM